MSDVSKRKTTRREFLKIFGLSSASILASDLLTDEILAQSVSHSPSHRICIPVTVLVKPNALRPGRNDHFTVAIVLPEGYRTTEIDASTVRCEGARALDNFCDSTGRNFITICNSADLRKGLPYGFPVTLNVTGCLLDSSTFQGSDKVAIVEPDQNIIYHTSSRGRKSCKACRGHAVNRIYSSSQSADRDRAHTGCNCRIVEERIGWRDHLKAFWPDSSGGKVVYDRRWGWPPASPLDLAVECPPALREHLRRG